MNVIVNLFFYILFHLSSMNLLNIPIAVLFNRIFAVCTGLFKGGFNTQTLEAAIV